MKNLITTTQFIHPVYSRRIYDTTHNYSVNKSFRAFKNLYTNKICAKQTFESNYKTSS